MNIFKFLIIFFSINLLFAELPSFDLPGKIVVKNTILAKVGKESITTYDVYKKLENSFQKAYPDLITSNSARYQFYLIGWKQTLDDLINVKLMILHAEQKEIKVTPAEIREELLMRYGPNLMANLQKYNMSYEEAFKTTKDDMLIQRIYWNFIKVKADQKITPSLVKNMYRLYISQNPTYQEYSYNVITISSQDENLGLINKLKILLNEKNDDPLNLKEEIKKFESEYKNTKISISERFNITSKDLSSSHKLILDKLVPNSYSEVNSQKSRFNNMDVQRIFYLKDLKVINPETFEKMSVKLKDELSQKMLNEEAFAYFEKLKKEFTVEKNSIVDSKEYIPFIFER